MIKTKITEMFEIEHPIIQYGKNALCKLVAEIKFCSR